MELKPFPFRSELDMENWMLWAGLALVVLWTLKPRVPEADCLSPAQLKARLAEGGLQLVDVRTSGEFRAGSIPGARLIPLSELSERTAELDRNKPVVLACRSGNRSAQAYKTLKALGFEKVSHLAGGLAAWGAAGLTVQR
jgi:rhodanese-related sulfurtransferase